MRPKLDITEGPHRMVDGVLDGIAVAAQGVVNTVVSGVKGAGKSIMVAADEPWTKTIGIEGPHRVVDRVLDTGADIIQDTANFPINELKRAGQGICSALDHPIEQLGK